MDTQTIEGVISALDQAPKEIYSHRIILEPVKIFYRERKYGLSESLKECSESGYNPLFMPELAKAKSKANRDSILWKEWFLTPSIKATGRTKSGSPIVVYAHVPNYFSNSENIRSAIEGDKLINGAGPMPKEEFYRLLDLQDNKRVFVVDHDKLKNSTNRKISVEEALAHPQTIPFLGGEQIAADYLIKHKEVYGENNIGVWHTDDLQEEPMGRVLVVGSSYNSGLNGFNGLGSDGRVFGVAPEAQNDEKNSASENLEKKLI